MHFNSIRRIHPSHPPLLQPFHRCYHLHSQFADGRNLHSGRRIIAILKKNPDKDPDKYDEDDVDHMRRVVAYCKRHLAQEDKAKRDPKSRSARSLKNWGHDPGKA
ncbi:hypothetical protein F4779DRAFT_587306 [Xylariaceae sp. FL0662B]|nr:hypothetical protein F4779DRAFT_587306 [Xylariaceae sp. FL0662B]